jgi:2-polyprenyl-6-methoxyphenol hydroxylase-like FAD-dependent oxidoreductase
MVRIDPLIHYLALTSPIVETIFQFVNHLRSTKSMATECDVVVVGYGPVGMVTAALLGQHGHRVVVLERYADLYNLPRAASFDDETMRTFAQLGIAERLLPRLRLQQTYQWCNGAGELLLEQQFDLQGRSGWAEWNMMYQPDLEDALDAVCRRLEEVDLRQGCTVTAITQSAAGARVAYERDGVTHSVTARFVIGCDGGGSFTRGHLGIGEFDYGFSEPWMVCDFAFKREVELPMARQVGDPAAPTSIISIGLRHHRFSFMLDSPGDFSEQSDPARVWQRVADYLGPDDAELIRVATYTFRSLVADQWRAGNVLLAGDAAHQMPPFLGQGMCSGIRDARNLAFKLDLLLRDAADPSILDTYQREREPHVRSVIETGVLLGRRQTLRHPAAAAERDRAMRQARDSATAPARLLLPGLGPGLLSSRHALGGGQLSAHGIVTSDGRQGLLDDVVGGGFCLLAATPAARALTADGLEKRLGDAGVRVVELVPDGDEASGALPAGSRADASGTAASGIRVADTGKTYQRWFAELGAAAVIVRPDFYVYGAVADAAATPDLARELLDSIGVSRR